MTRKSDKIYTSLKADILSYPPGSKYFSIRKIMQRFSCGQRIIENALQQLEGEKLIYREPCVGIFRSNTADSEQNSGKRIKLIVPDWPSDVISERVRGITAESQKNGWIIQTHYCNAENKDFMNQSVNGFHAMIFINPLKRLDWDVVSALANWSKQIPVVLFGHSGDMPVNSVCSMDEFSAFLAMSYLYEKGHRSIIMIISEPQNYTITQRIQGAVNFASLHRDVSMKILNAHTSSGEFAIQKGYDKMMEYLKTEGHNFTALYSDSHDSSLGVLRALRENNLQVPEDVSIIVNDILPQGSFFTPPLTAVGSLVSAQVEKVMEGLMNIFNRKTNHFRYEVRPRIEVRESVMPCKKTHISNFTEKNSRKREKKNTKTII